MSLKQVGVKYLQLTEPANRDGQRPAIRLMAAAETPLGVGAAVVIGGVIGTMPAIDVFVCALVASGGVALVCAVAAWLFDAPMGPGLAGLSDDFGQLRPLRFRRAQHTDRAAAPDQPTRPSSSSDPAPVADFARNPTVLG